MMNNQTLAIKLNQVLVGYVTHYQDGKNIFIFADEYIENQKESRPILSLSLTDFTKPIVTRHRLPNFFSNLLPEGELRHYLASQLGISAEDEFSLLAAFADDLPGAIIAEKTNIDFSHVNHDVHENDEAHTHDNVLHFSLAGVQIKFSMLKEKSWFTLSKNSLPGNYIVKTPSTIYPQVPENEFSMMSLAKAVGINVPEIQLITLEQIKNLPPLNLPNEKYAYAIKRFDRETHRRIHMEDFAQVFNIKPQKKYQATNYDTMAKFIYNLLPAEDIVEFLRRLFFTILIGNTDAHLKNWSLLYQDGETPRLAPAYDLVSTLPYLSSRNLALNLAKQKDFYAIDKETFKYFAARAEIPEALVFDVLSETTQRFKQAWKVQQKKLPLFAALKDALQSHWQQLKF